jgi:WD40 repeat protein
MAFSTDGHFLATPGEGHGVQILDVATQKQLCLLPHGGMVRAVAFSPAGDLIATGGDDRTVRLWRVANGNSTGPSLNHPEAVTAAAFSSDGQILVTGTIAGTVTLWSLPDGKKTAQFKDHQGPVWSAAFSPDGSLFATASADHTARIMTTATRQLVAKLKHNGQVWSAAFSPDGQTLLTASEDQTARLWEASTGQTLGMPFRASVPLRTAAFGGDGKVVVIGDREGMARLWHVASHKPLAAPFGNSSGPVLAATFLPGGKSICTASEDHLVFHWSVPTPVDAPAATAVCWTQVSTGMELVSGGAIEELTAAEWHERRQLLQKLDSQLLLP